MSLRQIIRRQKMFDAAVQEPFVIPGEPMIYSVRFPIGFRTRHHAEYFRNKAWKSHLKAFFRTFPYSSTPVVLIVRFMVSPPKHLPVPYKILRAEKTPAVQSFELCDYTLSFMEPLLKVLFGSYRQICRIDVEKIYSNDPRTIMQFMKWDEYVKHQDRDPVYPKTKRLSENRQVVPLQPECEGNADGGRICEETSEQESVAFTEGSPTCDSPFCVPCAYKLDRKKTQTATLPPAH